MTLGALLPILVGAWTLAAAAWAGQAPPAPAEPQRGKAVRGLVLDGDGRPVAAAEVRIERSLWEGVSETHPVNKVRADRGLYRAITGPEGRFEVADLPMPVLDLEIRGSGFAPFVQEGVRMTGPREVIDLGSFRLRPGAAVQGLVVDPRGRPVPGAAVWRGAEAEAPAAESGSDGRFVLRDLDPQETLQLFVCRSGFLSEAIQLEASTPEIARIELQPGARIAGRVVAPDGTPVSGAEIQTSLEVEGGGWGTGSEAPPCQLGDSAVGTTDAQGGFSLESLLPGTFQLLVSADGYPEETLKAESGLAGPPLTVRLRPGALLAGRITDLGGRPIAGVEISDRSGFQAVSRPDGTYRLSGVEPGVRRVQVSHPDHATLWKTLRIEPGENRFDAELSRIPRYPVRGRVLAPDGQPLAGARVQGSVRSFTTTAADGSFVLPLEDGTYLLESQAESYAPAWRTVQVAGGPVEGIDLRLSRGSTLTGRILGAAPQELAGATLLATSRESPLLWTTTVDPEGRYRLQGLFPGEWDVAVSTSRRDRHETLILAAGEEERELDIVLTEAFEVRGRVIGPEDEPVARAFVHFTGSADGAYVPTEADGSFSASLEEGTYQVEAEGQSAGYFEAAGPTIELRAPVDGIEIRLPRGTTLRGRVIGLELDDPRSVSIEARNGSLARFGKLTREGLYQLTGLAPGAWVVRARHGLDKVNAEVRIAPGAREAVLDLAFTPGPFTLSGTIEGAADLPSLAVLLERVDDEGAVSTDADPEGNFRFARLHPGRYRLTIHGAGLEGPHRAEIELSSDRELRVHLRAGLPYGMKAPG